MRLCSFDFRDKDLNRCIFTLRYFRNVVDDCDDKMTTSTTAMKKRTEEQCNELEEINWKRSLSLRTTVSSHSWSRIGHRLAKKNLGNRCHLPPLFFTNRLFTRWKNEWRNDLHRNESWRRIKRLYSFDFHVWLAHVITGDLIAAAGKVFDLWCTN